MKELKMGKMTTKELAEWMGISYGTFRNTASKKLEILKDYADYEKVRGGVIILHIDIPVYVKNFGIDDKVYLEEIKLTGNGLATLSGITNKVMKERPEYKDYSYNTVQRRMKNAGERTFGVTKDWCSQGIYGTRHYIWAVKINDYNRYRLMNDEERQIYIDLRNKYAGENGERFEKLALLKDAYSNHEINNEDYIREINRIDNYYEQVIIPFKESTGIKLVRTTLHEFAQGCSDEDWAKLQKEGV